MYKYIYIYIYIHISIYLSIYLPTYLSIYLPTYLPIYPSIHPSIDLSIYRSIDLSIYRSIDLSIYRSIDLSIYLFSIYLSIRLILKTMCAALSTLSQLGNRDGWFGTANLLQRRNVAFCICIHSNGNGTAITPQKHRMNIACKNLIKGNSLIQSWDVAFSFYIESDGDRRQRCFQLVGQGKKLQRLSATLFTSPCKQLPSSMVADAVYGLVVPGFVPPPPPSIPPPTSSIPPPTLPRLVAQHPPKQFHSLATTQGHNHHSFRVVFHTEFVVTQLAVALYFESRQRRRPLHL